MEIEWYSLTFELILMILAIDKVFKNEENGFSSKFQFLGVQLVKNSGNQKRVLDSLS